MSTEHTSLEDQVPDAHDYDLFVVHAPADAAFVREYLLPALELPRSRVLLVDELPLGGLIVSEIDRGVCRSRCTVAVLSPAYLEDRWADFGAELASYLHANEARVIPLRLAECKLPLRLDARVALDFTDRDRWPWETQRLRDALRSPTQRREPIGYPCPRERPTRRWLLGGALAGAASVLACVLLWPTRAAPSRAMARFSATSVRLGVFPTGSRPAQCRALSESEDCAVLEHPDSVGDTPVAAFELDKREVTNAEYAAWLNANVDLWQLMPYSIVELASKPTNPLLRAELCGDGLTVTSQKRANVTVEAARRPVVCVSWYGAREYCRAHDKRLPLEAEWELAAKGAEGRPFPWGIAPPRRDAVAFELGKDAAAHPRNVGESPQDDTPEGVRDLGANVAEWVEDGSGQPGMKTLRGGSFASIGPCHLLSSGCARLAAAGYRKDLGFRCARSWIEPQPGER